MRCACVSQGWLPPSAARASQQAVRQAPQYVAPWRARVDLRLSWPAEGSRALTMRCPCVWAAGGLRWAQRVLMYESARGVILRRRLVCVDVIRMGMWACMVCGAFASLAATGGLPLSHYTRRVRMWARLAGLQTRDLGQHIRVTGAGWRACRREMGQHSRLEAQYFQRGAVLRYQSVTFFFPVWHRYWPARKIST